MTLIPLSRLMIEGRPVNPCVALRAGEFIGFDRFRSDVAKAAAKFKGHHRSLLVCQDGYNFVVGFYGLLHANSEIVLPANRQPGTLKNLKQEYDFWVDDVIVEDGNDMEADLVSIDPMKSSLHFHTSGSTGTPKTILKNLQMLEVEITTLNNLWGNNAGQGSVFSTVPHQHIYGLTFKLLWPLMAGRPFISETHTFMESLLADLTPDATIISSPAHLSRLDGVDPLPKHRRPKQIFSAGAPLSYAASEQTNAIFGCRPTEIFGSTETGAFATRNQTNNDEPWRLLPGISMRQDADGRLSLLSPFVGPDWLTTEDLVKPVENGFHSLGRADRIAKIEGKRISLIEIEQALERLPYVKSVAVIMLHGNPNHLGAAVIPTEEGFVTLKKIGNFQFGRLLRNSLSSEQEAAGIPRLWRFVNDLPAQGLGKRRDADVRALFGYK